MAAPKRILFVTDLWTESPYGVLTVARNLKRELEAKGCEVDVMEPSQFLTFAFPLYKDVRLAPFSRGTVKRRILGGRYDQVHILTEGPIGFFARAICIKHRAPFTTAFNGQLHLYARVWLGAFAERLVKKVLIWFHSRSGAVIVATDAIRRELDEWGVKRVEICPMGADPIFFGTGTCPLQLERPVFLYFGRLSSEKSVEEFLAADLPGTKLLVGDGPDRAKLMAKYPNAHYAGYKSGQELVDYCSCADVMVMPSRTETFGLVIVESLAMGLPVAAHDVTGPREIIQSGVNGYLGEDLAAAAKRCLELSHNACHDSAKPYSWAASAERFLEIVRTCQQS